MGGVCPVGATDVLVALTREIGRNEELRRWVGSRAQVREIPLTSTHYRSRDNVAEEVAHASSSGGFRSLVVTSARVDRYVDVVTAALLPGALVYSVGAATTAMLRSHGLEVAYESPGTSLDLAPHVARGPVLVLGAVNGRDDVTRSLQSRALEYHLVECYETVPTVLDENAKADLGRADAVFIGAPSTWRAARELIASDAWVLVPGSTTLDEVRTTHDRVVLGWGPDFESAWRRVLDSTT